MTMMKKRTSGKARNAAVGADLRVSRVLKKRDSLKQLHLHDDDGSDSDDLFKEKTERRTSGSARNAAVGADLQVSTVLRKRESLTLFQSHDDENIDRDGSVEGCADVEDALTLRKSSKRNAFDLDGDGELDEIEETMARYDVNGDGQLDNKEVDRIVEDLLKAQDDVTLFKKVAAGLLCLVAILSVSNFGTSWVTSILTSDTVADSQSGTIQDKKTHKVMGFQANSLLFEMEDLDDEEFEMRRQLVVEEMAEDPYHPDHMHRRLVRNSKEKVAYDHGEVSKEVLQEMIKACRAGNTVMLGRRWKSKNGKASVTQNTICEPGVGVSQKKKKNKTNVNTECETKDFECRERKEAQEKKKPEKVTFERRGRDKKNMSLNVDCKRNAKCRLSGSTLIQDAGTPCKIQRDWVGATDCDEGERLVCVDPDEPNAKTGSGECIQLGKYSKNALPCNVDDGVDACVAGLGCYSARPIGGRKKINWGAQVHVGICRQVSNFSREKEVCSVEHGKKACVEGYSCLGPKGKKLGKRGLGICTKDNLSSRTTASNVLPQQPTGNWLTDYSLGVEGQCYWEAREEYWESDEAYGTPQECCKMKLWWMSERECVPGLEPEEWRTWAS